MKKSKTIISLLLVISTLLTTICVYAADSDSDADYGKVGSYPSHIRFGMYTEETTSKITKFAKDEWAELHEKYIDFENQYAVHDTDCVSYVEITVSEPNLFVVSAGRYGYGGSVNNKYYNHYNIYFITNSKVKYVGAIIKNTDENRIFKIDQDCTVAFVGTNYDLETPSFFFGNYKFGVINYTNEDDLKNLKLLIGYYDSNNVLINSEILNASEISDTYYHSMNAVVPHFQYVNDDTKYMRAFLWDAETMQPISDMQEGEVYTDDDGDRRLEISID